MSSRRKSINSLTMSALFIRVNPLFPTKGLRMLVRTLTLTKVIHSLDVTIGLREGGHWLCGPRGGHKNGELLVRWVKIFYI